MDSRIQRTFIRQHKHVDKHLNKLGNITVHEYRQETTTKVPILIIHGELTYFLQRMNKNIFYSADHNCVKCLLS